MKNQKKNKRKNMMNNIINNFTISVVNSLIKTSNINSKKKITNNILTILNITQQISISINNNKIITWGISTYNKQIICISTNNQ